MEQKEFKMHYKNLDKKIGNVYGLEINEYMGRMIIALSEGEKIFEDLYKRRYHEKLTRIIKTMEKVQEK